MSFFGIYITCTLGIVISIILPILRKSLPGGGPAGIGGIWDIAKPYVIVGVFSMLTAILVVAFAGDSLSDWKVALLTGYAWDSTLQKLKG